MFTDGPTDGRRIDAGSTGELKWGKSGVGIKMIKCGNFQYFSIKSYAVDVY